MIIFGDPGFLWVNIPMISADMKGRTGNNLFQIAAAEALARRVGTSAAFDLSRNHLRTTLLRNVAHISNYAATNHFIQSGFGYREMPLKDDLRLTGWFQSEKYFLDFSDHIGDLFHLDEGDIQKIRGVFGPIMDGNVTTAMHVRRGDYVHFPDKHPICGMEYYTNAMDYLRETGKENKFILVSDDMKWVRENFKGDDILYSPFNDILMDLTLMTCMDNNIIANSTFSWWGAYLNRTPSKKVVAPLRWFGDRGPQERDDIVPANWTRL